MQLEKGSDIVLENVTISLKREKDNLIKTIKTDESGTFEINSVEQLNNHLSQYFDNAISTVMTKNFIDYNGMLYSLGNIGIGDDLRKYIGTTVKEQTIVSIKFLLKSEL